MALYKEKDKKMKIAYKSYLGRLKSLPENKRNPNRMSWSQFKANYTKTKAVTNPVERGLRQSGISYGKAQRLSGG